MKKVYVFMFLVLGGLFNCVNAQLLQWNTFGNAGTETTEPSVANDPNLAGVTNLTQGAGITPAGNENCFGGSNWWDAGNSVNSTLPEAVAGSNYIEFIVTPNVGFSFTPTSFVFNWDKSAFGPQNVGLRSSVDGFTSNLGVVAPTAAIATQNTITISGLTNLTTATTFRVYGYGGTATDGTGGFDIGTNVVNVILNGTTASTASNTISTGVVSAPPFCVNGATSASGTVAFTSTGTYAGETFTAQLSDAAGSFAAPIAIGSTTATGVNPSGTINITIPAGTVTGVGYKIRIDEVTLPVIGTESVAFTIINGVQNVTTPAASVANVSTNLTWVNPIGCYDDILILAATAANTWVPTGTTYTINSVYGAGTMLGNGWAVYQGTGSGQPVTGLTNGTPYFYKFFTRSGTTWSAGIEVSATPTVVTLATDYFRSKIATGNWDLPTTWESSIDNIFWVNSTLAPNENANTITIRNTHVVTVTVLGASADQLVVEAGATLALAGNLTVADGAAAIDMTVDGTVINTSGTHTAAGTIMFNNGSLYQHARDGGIVLPATWAINSTAEIIGILTATTLNCGNQTFGNFTWNSAAQTSNLNLTGTLATINRNFHVQNSGTSSLRMTGATNLNLVVGGNFTIDDDLNFDNSATGTTTVSVGGNFVHSAGTFQSQSAVVPITMTGAANSFTQSGGTFLGTNLNWIINTGAQITLNNDLPLATSSTLTIDGILNCGVLAVNGAGSIAVNNGGRVRVGSINAAGAVNDNLSASGGLTLNTGSTVEFNGLAAQFTASRAYSNIEINNANGVTLLGAVFVNSVLGLTSGIVTTTATNLLTLTNGASYTGGNSNSSYVNGPVKKIGMDPFTFPVGKSNGYVPIGIDVFVGGTVLDEFTAEYIRSSARALGPITAGAGLDHVSYCDHWKLDKGIATPASVDVKLYWSANNVCGGVGSYINDLGSLTMAHFDGAGWDSYPTSPVVTGGSTITAGSITWPTVTTFSPFSLASTTFGTNPLPITINYFNGTKNNGNHLLNWKVTCISTPAATLEMERSTDGRNFTSIYSIYATALRCARPFDYTDNQPAKGVNYYRLKMTSADGKVTYSSIVSLINDVKGIDILNIAPNPVVNGTFNLKISSAVQTAMELLITDMQGRVLQKQTTNLIAGFNSLPMHVRNLAAGTYQLFGNTADGKTRVLRFVIQ